MSSAALPPTALDRERVRSIMFRVLRGRCTVSTTNEEINEAVAEIIAALTNSGLEIRQEEIPF